MKPIPANHWGKRIIEWTEETPKRRAYLSIVFTWHMPRAYMRAVWFRAAGYEVSAGGPAVSLMPRFLAGVAELGGKSADAVARHNPNATFTTRGCVRRCPFCAVWRLEGEFRELKVWPVRPIVCDNNLLGASRAHFDQVIDRLKSLPYRIDFNQGLDARLLTKHHADRIAELDCIARLAFDHAGDAAAWSRAFGLLRNAGLPARRIQTYVLIGFDDSPEDALYRLSMVRAAGGETNPMRFQPLDSMRYNSYVAPGWTHKELMRFMRYWSNLRYFRSIPFCDFENRQKGG